MGVSETKSRAQRACKGCGFKGGDVAEVGGSKCGQAVYPGREGSLGNGKNGVSGASVFIFGGDDGPGRHVRVASVRATPGGRPPRCGGLRGPSFPASPGVPRWSLRFGINSGGGNDEQIDFRKT
ncbi:uncharacterized protein LOC144456898 isoform X2 [Phascolarctos cinereus]